MVVRAEDIGRIGFAVDIEDRARQMKHRCRADTQLEVATDVARNSGGLGNVRDLDGGGDATVLAGINLTTSAAWARRTFHASASVKTLSSTMMGIPSTGAMPSFGVAGCDRLFGDRRRSGRSRSSAIRAVVTFQPQLASIVMAISGPATSRTALTRARSPARSSPTFTFRHRTPQLRNCSASADVRQVECADHHLGRDDIPKLAPQELVDRHSRALPAMSQRAISTAALVNGLSLIRKSINLRRVEIWVGSAPDKGRPDQVVERGDAALARLAAPESGHGRLAETDKASIGVQPDDDVVRRVMIAVGRLGDHAGLERHAHRDCFKLGDSHGISINRRITR